MRIGRRLGCLMATAAVAVTGGCSAGRPAAGQSPGRAHLAVVHQGLRLVSYHGVHVTVPAAWPVVDGMHTLFCGDPFPPAATAFVGPQENGAPTCPAPPPGSAVPRDGVWLAPGSGSPGGRQVRTAAGVIVRELRLGPRGHLKMLWYHGVSVEIGIGPDPAVARSIVDSIGFTAHEPDTRAAGSCAQSAHLDQMPVPRRLGRSLVLRQPGITLRPPPRAEQPLISAAAAWQRTTLREPSFEQYRIILAVYSAQFPARTNASGGLTPEYRNVFAWVIYGSQVSAGIPGCGGWSLTAYNARTGQGLDTIGWG